MARTFDAPKAIIILMCLASHGTYAFAASAVHLIKSEWRASLEQQRPETTTDNFDLQKLTTAAEKGDSDAAIELAGRYEKGNGVPTDLALAARWNMKAARAGKAEAQRKVGEAFLLGEGVSQDFTEAFRWFLKAAEQSNAVAEDLVAGMYRTGRGTPTDFDQAAKWYKKAADQGEPDAQQNLGNMYFTGQGKPYDLDQAALWLQRSKAQGNRAAQQQLIEVQLEQRRRDLAKAGAAQQSAGSQGLIITSEAGPKSLAEAENLSPLDPELEAQRKVRTKSDTENPGQDISHSPSRAVGVLAAISGALGQLNDTLAAQNAEAEQHNAELQLRAQAQAAANNARRTKEAAIAEDQEEANRRSTVAHQQATAQQRQAVARQATTVTTNIPLASSHASDASASSCMEIGTRCVSAVEWARIQSAPTSVTGPGVVTPWPKVSTNANFFSSYTPDTHLCPSAGYINTGHYSGPDVWEGEKIPCTPGSQVIIHYDIPQTVASAPAGKRPGGGTSTSSNPPAAPPTALPSGFIPSRGSQSSGNSGAGYGTIALNRGDGTHYITINMPSWTLSDSEAVRLCNDNCEVVDRFINTCAAVARDNMPGSTIWGWAEGPGPDAAMQSAINKCMSNGGGACYAPTFACSGVKYVQH